MITVNGTPIDAEDIAREVQYHPAATLDAAKDSAARALVVRHLLLHQAAALGIADGDEEDVVAALLAREVQVPVPDEATCRRFYDANPHRFRSADLFEAAHILVPAHPKDETAREAARQKCQDLIRILLAEPQRFAGLAAAHSACESKHADGHLGQIARGSTNPEFETFLVNVEPGLCPVPVPSRHGYHVLRLDRRILGVVQPYDTVRDGIADFLRNTALHRAYSQYVQVLVGIADIRGIDLRGADGPLVQ